MRSYITTSCTIFESSVQCTIETTFRQVKTNFDSLDKFEKESGDKVVKLLKLNKNYFTLNTNGESCGISYELSTKSESI